MPADTDAQTVQSPVTVTELEEAVREDRTCDGRSETTGIQCPNPAVWKMVTHCPGCGYDGTSLMCQQHYLLIMSPGTWLRCVFCDASTRESVRWYPV